MTTELLSRLAARLDQARPLVLLGAMCPDEQRALQAITTRERYRP